MDSNPPYQAQRPAASAGSDTGSVEVSSLHRGSDDQAASSENVPKADVPKPEPPRKEPKKFVPPQIPSTNLLVIDRKNQDIKGTWMLDPTKVIPPSLLPEFKGPPVERPTLLLRSRSGSVAADIWLSDVSATVEKPISIDVTADYFNTGTNRGTAVVMLHSVGKHIVNLHIGGVRNFIIPRQDPPRATEGMPPLVDLLLPPDFTGCLLLDESPNVITSSTLAKRVTQFSDEEQKNTWFLGDWEGTGFGNGEWKGSSVRVRGYIVRLGVTECDEDWINAAAPLGLSAIDATLK